MNKPTGGPLDGQGNPIPASRTWGTGKTDDRPIEREIRNLATGTHTEVLTDPIDPTYQPTINQRLDHLEHQITHIENNLKALLNALNTITNILNPPPP